MTLLKDVLEQLPEQNLPEIALASEDDGLDAAKDKLETDDDYRRALAKLRNLAVEKFVEQLRPALADYLGAHGGRFPADVSELQLYMKQKIDEAIWRRYEITSADTVGNVIVGGKMIITQVSVVDPTFDHEYVLGPEGMGSSSFGTGSIMALEKTYRKAEGKFFDDPRQLLPYASTPRQKAAVLALIERSRASQLAK